ncbi:MAG: hypothetical protein IJ151_08150 [Bacteroidales bacterium]|nr:hypothetical protein [Bacteroidales bacterium]
MADIHLYVLSPEEILADLMVSSVTLPGTVSPFQVLRQHAGMISSLEKGRIVYTSPEGDGEIEIGSGFAKILDNEVIVCVEK